MKDNQLIISLPELLLIPVAVIVIRAGFMG